MTNLKVGMRISEIKTYPVSIGKRNQLLVKVETDAGIYGWGESGLSGRELAVVGAIKHYREFLLGRNPLQIGALWQEMYRGQYFEGGRVLTAAISAIDIALHDIVGKALSVPVYQLLGGKQRDKIPCFATAVTLTEPEQLAEIQLLLEQGWQVIRLATSHANEAAIRPVFEPRESIAQTANLVNKVRQEFGADFVLGIDYHHRLSVAETASFCQRLQPGALDFIEEPIRDETPEAYETLRQMTNIPFAIGEEFASKWQFLPYIERGITNFARIDVCNVGGFTEAIKVAAMAEAHYIDLMPHDPLGPICTASSIHLAAAVPNFAWLEYLPAMYGNEAGEKDIFLNAPVIEATAFPVLEGPGLGIDVDESALANNVFQFWAAPQLRRSDGSITNW